MFYLHHDLRNHSKTIQSALTKAYKSLITFLELTSKMEQNLTGCFSVNVGGKKTWQSYQIIVYLYKKTRTCMLHLHESALITTLLKIIKITNPTRPCHYSFVLLNRCIDSVHVNSQRTVLVKLEDFSLNKNNDLCERHPEGEESIEFFSFKGQSLLFWFLIKHLDAFHKMNIVLWVSLAASSVQWWL